MILRPYQRQALDRIESDRVCLVCPTGGGKTAMAAAWATETPGRTLWIAHRIELVRQAAAALSRLIDPLDVGVIAPGEANRPHARIQVATVQTLLARDTRPPADRVVLDEAHHYSADDWRTVLDAYPSVRLLGLTATPERRDGKPLGDIFDQLVVAARYPDLVEAGHLVDCRAFIPPGELGTGALALDPLVAYERHTPGERAFLFAPSVAQAAAYAEQFTAAGHPARAITERTSKRDRATWLEEFAASELRVLANVYTLTEGVDIPAASVAILARRIVHVSMYLQIAGRILRPHPSKSRATLLDLTGATIEHGLPTEDRIYSLDGRPIRRCNESLRQCPQCGAVFENSPTTCPECGYDFPARKAPPPPRIYSLELREVYAGKATPTEAKREEFVRLWRLARERGWSLGWVVKEYTTLFGQPPLTFTAAMRGELKREEFDRLAARAAERGYSSGWVAHAYRRTFGAWPPSSWRVAA